MEGMDGSSALSVCAPTRNSTQQQLASLVCQSISSNEPRPELLPFQPNQPPESLEVATASAFPGMPLLVSDRRYRIAPIVQRCREAFNDGEVKSALEVVRANIMYKLRPKVSEKALSGKHEPETCQEPFCKLHQEEVRILPSWEVWYIEPRQLLRLKLSVIYVNAAGIES